MPVLIPLSHAPSSEPPRPSVNFDPTPRRGGLLSNGFGNGHHRGNSVSQGSGEDTAQRPQFTENVRTNSVGSTASQDSVKTIFDAIGDQKPIASGNGVAVSIALAEPVLFLQGFDHSVTSERTTCMLRGSLHLRVSKPAKIKAVTLRFRGRAETEWPEGIPPRKVEFKDVQSIMNHTWTFFNAQFQNNTDSGYGADHVHLQGEKGPSTITRELGVTSSAFDHFQRSASPSLSKLNANDERRLSLQLNHSRSFGKGDMPNGNTGTQKGYRMFQPGDYIYNFELPIDSRLPETINVELGNVKYCLEAIVERAGAFRANLLGSKEVTLIRAPSEGSLEQVEPIAISRNWEDQLHYDIVISGKSFPLGSQVPIAFKLTPLAKVQCHRIKVYVTENIQYYTGNKRVHRLEPTRKVQLFEKRADGPSVSTFPGSEMRILSGGGVSYDSREAAARGEENIARDTTNLLGDLEGEHNVGPTEMEFNVQLPSCHNIKEHQKASNLHFDTTFPNIQVHHWIKIVMRLSKPDAADRSKRRHFEISIDSPFHILSCRATQANIALPAYSSPESGPSQSTSVDCGCPDATPQRSSTSQIPTMNSLRINTNSTPSNNDGSSPNDQTANLTRPPVAHLHDPTASSIRSQTAANHDHNSGASRPIHLLRNPSFNPPPFSEEEPPPPLITPPPQYDSVAPRNGLADYFSRLADEAGEEDDLTRGNGRMDIPLTPGGRINRSMDERRTWLPIGGSHTQ